MKAPARKDYIERPFHTWQLQTAKARFSEVFRLALTEGPQLITRQGKDGVVLLSFEQFEQLTRAGKTQTTLFDFFRSSPLVGVELDLQRDKDRGRDVGL